jgi:phospholipid/cholesterol/gamma-HCH transport system permease protein
MVPANDREEVSLPPRPPDIELSIQSVVMRPGQLLIAAGEIVRYSVRVIIELAQCRQYLSEVFRQAGILIISSGLVIWTMMVSIGAMCGVEAHYLLEQVGTPLYSGMFASYCGLRESQPYVWGYILAAKVGCGIVAELGSMRISDEIDAMEVMAIRSLPYLAGSRLLAAWIAMPFLYIIGTALTYVMEYLTIVDQLGGVSKGGYLYVFWLFQSPMDLVFSMLKALAMGTVIVLVACFYGYTASGGPVGVGRNTSKSMMVNLILIHLIGMVGTAMFWGFAPNAPIAN